MMEGMQQDHSVKVPVIAVECMNDLALIHSAIQNLIDSPMLIERPLIILRSKGMVNENYNVLVYKYALGQMRLQLCDKRLPDRDAPCAAGSIVREMCTYKLDTAVRVLSDLMASSEPEEYCRSLESPTRCEYPRGRIRLDQ